MTGIGGTGAVNVHHEPSNAGELAVLLVKLETLTRELDLAHRQLAEAEGRASRWEQRATELDDRLVRLTRDCAAHDKVARPRPWRADEEL